MKHSDRPGGKVLFRADASQVIGAGHVMRCLTLADALRAQSYECTFVCRPFAEGFVHRIREAGHSLVILPERAATPEPQSIEATWPNAEQDEDARLCLQAVAPNKFDWAVVDHYGLDRRWQAVIRREIPRIMVIDDLANRAHDCDLLLDHNLGRSASDYRGLTPAGTKVLAGPTFALLRPRFAACRAAALKRRENPRPSRLLISVGGSDPRNVTGKLLRALHGPKLPEGLAISVVLGPLATNSDDVCRVASAMGRPVEVVFDVEDMAELMVQCDVAIGAAGVTALERCCLGLPTLVVVMAENQRPGAEALSAAGAAMTIDLDMLGEFDFGTFFAGTIATPNAVEMSRNAASICDGLGVDRVCEAMNA